MMPSYIFFHYLIFYDAVPETELSFGALRKSLLQLVAGAGAAVALFLIAGVGNYLNVVLSLLSVHLTFP